MTRSNHGVIIGGFTTGKKRLRYVADALRDTGVVETVEAFTLPQAMKFSAAVEFAVRGNTVITHSVGIMALSASMRPAELLACDGPEHRPDEDALSFSNVCKSVLTKMGNTRGFIGDKDNPLAAGYRAINRDNKVQTLLHPWAHIRLIKGVLPFSTSEDLRGRADENPDLRVAAAVTRQDEFWPHNPVRDYGSVPVFEHFGNHDEILVDPMAVIGGWIETIRQ